MIYINGFFYPSGHKVAVQAQTSKIFNRVSFVITAIYL